MREGGPSINETDERLLWMLRVLADEFGALGVLCTAVALWPDAAKVHGRDGRVRGPGALREASAMCKPSTGDVAAAIETIEDSRRTHVEWRDYWFGQKGWEDCEGCRDKAAHVGGPRHHERCIRDYDNVLTVLRSIFAAEGGA